MNLTLNIVTLQRQKNAAAFLGTQSHKKGITACVQSFLLLFAAYYLQDAALRQVNLKLQHQPRLMQKPRKSAKSYQQKLAAGWQEKSANNCRLLPSLRRTRKTEIIEEHL